ncbi:gamma-glutamylcyclotransferase family protein [Pseudoprimorskyibacter insulae]|uniref:Gamma-glutamylcyclotransferase AIG2-like domain-containing protein n=1 Tax=Pseudoprimorskyibacter insulae TaxID=1695997 RepID=A0A2R8APQ7_9RHOB|nr:gamma-glutamylcyclotransferase family protein [Pseudoprimorskyibacter insulae]SPF77960.1 hypothetical protein PRI8871_00548 [Pseudoprimorskyibacter insulae]
MPEHYFFGYGSLVNRRTHDFTRSAVATAKGWRRAWRYTPDRQVAFLTAIPDADCTISGLIAHVPHNDWAALDVREAAYDRVPATHVVDHGADGVDDIAIYAIHPDRMRLPDGQHPVLLSYIDVVVQGYLAEFGASGAEAFFATTTGWEAPILNDRANPRYPRAQRLHESEQGVVDDALRKLGCTVMADMPAL